MSEQEKIWEEVALEVATHVEINGEIHEITKQGKVTKFAVEGGMVYSGISVLCAMGWQFIRKDAFSFLGIKTLREKKREPLEFVRETTKSTPCSILPVAWIPLPKETIGKKFKLIEILEEE